MMSTWKRLTRDNSETLIDVNMDHVVDIERQQGRSYSTLTFNFTKEKHLHTLSVKETPVEIHQLPSPPK